MNMIKDFLREEDGATAIEYALIVGLIAIAIIGALSLLGGNITTLFGKIAGELGKVEVGEKPTTGG